MGKNTIGEKIKQLRNRKGLLQSDLAHHLSVTNGAISNWENNRRLPSIEELKKICLLFDVPLDYFAEAPNYGLSEDHIQYSRAPKMESITFEVPKPDRKGCPFLVVSVISLFLSGLFMGPVAIFLWFFGLYSLIIYGITRYVQKDGNRINYMKTITVEADLKIIYRHPKESEELSKMKKRFTLLMILGSFLEVIFLSSVFILLYRMQFYVGIILMIVFALGSLVFNYHRLYSFQNGNILEKEIPFRDLNGGFRYPVFFVAVMMSVFALVFLAIILLFFEEAYHRSVYAHLSLFAVIAHFVINYYVYVEFRHIIVEYELCAIDDASRVIRLLSDNE
jgi:transcriptional regulator with XRE-family HTH domain